MTLPHRPEFYLAATLRRAFQREGGSYAKLARRITEEHRAATNEEPTATDFVDRRKLKDIAEERHFVISREELEAIESYLELFGDGLSRHPLFKKPSVLEDLANAGHIVFLIGVRPQRIRLEVSLADLQALGEIQRQVSGISSRDVTFDVRPVCLGDNAEASRAVAAEIGEEYFVDDGPTVVVIGSPRANPAAEVCFSRLLSLPSFQSSWNSPNRPPFSYVWPHVTPDFVSCVAHSLEEVREDHPAGAFEMQQTGRWGFRMKGDLALADPGGANPIDTYGLVAAQRRRRGQIWMVLAGLSGVGTMGTARVLRRLRTQLPEPGSLLWAAVAAQGTEGRWRIPRVTEQPVVQPEVWTPTTVEARS